MTYTDYNTLLAERDELKREFAARLAEAERDIVQWKKVYDLRGRALQRPRSNCGYVPLVIHADAALAPAAQGTAAQDDGCICKGNWRAIVKETEHLLDREFTDKDGNLYTFYGIVHGSDDYYYGMIGKTGRELLSCVGSIESYGFDLATNTQGAAK